MPTQQQIERLKRLNDEMFSSARNEAPPEDEIDFWEPVVDMDTNKVRWMRKDLFNEIQELRFSPAWHESDELPSSES
jgi:hypothetical protein